MTVVRSGRSCIVRTRLSSEGKTIHRRDAENAEKIFHPRRYAKVREEKEEQKGGSIFAQQLSLGTLRVPSCPSWTICLLRVLCVSAVNLICERSACARPLRVPPDDHVEGFLDHRVIA